MDMLGNDDRDADIDSPLQDPDVVISDAFLFQIQEPTDFFCPEYDFEKQLADYHKILAPTLSPLNTAPDSPTSSSSWVSGVENNDLTALKTMKPYDPTQPNKLRSFPRDINDLGDGYVDDSFVDTSEKIVDATIPPGFTTQYGGYYIGNGKLHIRPLQPNEQQTHVYEQPSSETCMQMCNSVLDGRKKTSSEGLNNRDGNLTGVDEKKKSKRKGMEADEKTEPPPKVVRSVKENSAKTPKTGGKILPKETPVEVDDNRGLIFAVKHNDSSQPESDSSDEKSASSVGLPQGLPQELVANIRAFTSLAQKTTQTKVKFTNPTLNPEGMELLLRIEYDTQKIGSKRGKVYMHMASFCPISKKTLANRARSLRVDDAEKRSEVILQKMLKAMDDSVGQPKKDDELLVRNLAWEAVQTHLLGLDANKKSERDMFLKHWFSSNTWKSIKNSSRFSRYGVEKMITEKLSAEAKETKEEVPIKNH